jgi:hypothetical protein
MKSNCINCDKLFTYNANNTRGKYCCIACSTEYRQKQSTILSEARYQDWLSGVDLGVKHLRKLLKGYLTKRDGYKCSCCGIDSYNNKPITLWIDHIDGDATNNKPDNFRFMCPNCDSQSETFGGKNHGKGRKSRGLPQYG